MNTLHTELNLLKLKVEYSYVPFRKGRYFGPPEDCYPDEPSECEVGKVWWETKDANGNPVTVNVAAVLTEKQLDALTEECAEFEEQEYVPDYEPDFY